MGPAELRGDMEFTEGYVQADEFHIRYVEAAQGSPLVTLPGMGGRMLSKVHHALAQKYRVIAFEIPGFGQSPLNATSQSDRIWRRQWRRPWQSLG